MRRACVLVAACLLAAIPGRTAEAAAIGYIGSLSLEISTFPPVVIPGSGTAIVNGSSGTGELTGLELAAIAFATTARVVPITDPAAAPIQGIQVTGANGAGAFGGVAGAGFGGVMPLMGVTRICLFAACNAAVANLTVPLSVVGAGGSAYVTGAIGLTVVGAPWTTQTAAIGTITAMGFGGPISQTALASSDSISLVTPVFLVTSINPIPVPVFAFLNLHFVPEPGTVLLLGAGIAGLVAFARRRRLTGT